MNRTFALGIVLTVLGWLALWGYDSGDDHRVDYGVIGFTVLVALAVIVHMGWDRRLRLWDTGATGIAVREVGWIALFVWFGLRFHDRTLDPGVSQGLLDVVRVAAPVGGAFILCRLIDYRLHKQRSGEPAIPGEMLVVAPEKPWQPGDPDRRSGVDRRRSTAEIYGRTTEDTTL